MDLLTRYILTYYIVDYDQSHIVGNFDRRLKCWRYPLGMSRTGVPALFQTIDIGIYPILISRIMLQESSTFNAVYNTGLCVREWWVVLFWTFCLGIISGDICFRSLFWSMQSHAVAGFFPFFSISSQLYNWRFSPQSVHTFLTIVHDVNNGE